MNARFAAAAEERDYDHVFSSPTIIAGLQSPITPTASFRGRSVHSQQLAGMPRQNPKLGNTTSVQRRLFAASGPSSIKRPNSTVSFDVDSIIDVSAAPSAGSIYTPSSKTRAAKKAKISEAVCPATDHTLVSSSPKASARLVPDSSTSRAVTRLSRRLFVDVSRFCFLPSPMKS